MYFLLSDNFKSFCCYDNASVGGESRMDIFMLERGLEFCRQNFMQPVLFMGMKTFLQLIIHVALRDIIFSIFCRFPCKRAAKT